MPAIQNSVSGAESYRAPGDNYQCQSPWNDARPRVLVVACSDGRLQENLDEFLNARGISHYDRLFVPGGPGALASSGYELIRHDQLRRETQFLIVAHGVEELFLIFHGAAPDGPEAAACADYKRKLPGLDAAQINAVQETDVAELLRLFAWPTHLQVRIFRAEVGGDAKVRFVALLPPGGKAGFREGT